MSARRVAWEWVEVYSEDEAKLLMGFVWGPGVSWIRVRYTAWFGRFVECPGLRVFGWRFIRPIGGPEGAQPDRFIEVTGPTEQALALARCGWEPQLVRGEIAVAVRADDTHESVLARLDAARGQNS